MINTILYATDLGLYAPYLLQHVMSLAGKHKAKVVAVHAIEPIGVFAESILEAHIPPQEVKTLRRRGFTDVMDQIREQVENAFEDDFAECSFDSELIGGIQVINGKPSDVILEMARQVRADLIVMGSSSQPAEQPVLGSVASKVLSQSEVPVYLVPMVKLQSPYNLELYHRAS